MKNLNRLLCLSWIYLALLTTLCCGCYREKYDVEINKDFDIDFDVPDEYWSFPDNDGEDSQVLQISQIIIKKYKTVKLVTEAPWEGGQTIPPDITVISLRVKFPHFIRHSRALSLHDKEEGLVKMKTDKILEALIPTYSNFVSKEATIILESEDELPQSTTALHFTNVLNSEAIINDMEGKTAAIADDEEIITLSIKAYADGRISQSCSNDNDCVTRGAECVDSRCRCGDRYEQSETTCIPDGNFMSPCQKTRECTGQNERCLDGFCYCQNRYEPVNNFCVKRSPFGQNCTSAHDCELDELQCKDLTCQCKDVYYTHEQNCYLMVNYGDECIFDEQCSSNEHCSEEKRCTCNAPLEYFEDIGCRRRKDIGDECIITEECLGNDVRCTSSVCTCVEGKGQHVDGTNVCVRLLLTTTYPLVLDAPWNPTYADKDSAGYASVANTVRQVYEGADIPGFVEVLSVDLSENTDDGKIMSSTVFTSRNPDAIFPDRRRHVTRPLNIEGGHVKYSESEVKQRLMKEVQPLLLESLRKVAMQKTIDYQLILKEAYNETLHSDPASSSYKSKVKSIKRMVQEAGVAELRAIKRVELRKGKEGHLAAVIQFKIKSSLETRRLSSGKPKKPQKLKANPETHAADNDGEIERLLKNHKSVNAVKLMEVTNQLKYYK